MPRMKPDVVERDRPNSALAGASVAFIGAGAMAEAMIGGLLSNRLVEPAAITVSDPRAARNRDLRERYHVESASDNRTAAHQAQIVVLAVKPQVLTTVFEELGGTLPANAVVVSIVAGARIETIEDGLRHPSIVRSMPNTPAQVSEGMTVWTATSSVTGRQRGQAQALLGALGREMYVDAESFLDMATAISGSGPAYVLLMMEALIDAAVHLGFSRADARTLVTQTVYGTAAYALESSLHPAELRNQVTSPGGTTAHALYQLEKGEFRAVLSRAVWAAYQRSVALGATSSQSRPSGEEDPQRET